MELYFHRWDFRILNMSEIVVFSKAADRETIYREIEPQLAAMIEVESDQIANLGNISAMLKEALQFLWVGFYLEKNGELVLGPFQGTIACTRIANGQGVCGKALSRRETIIVPDVDEFPGHIVCSSAAKSEIVIPVFRKDGSVFGVLDVDSDRLDDFSDIDRKGLKKIANLVENSIAA